MGKIRLLSQELIDQIAAGEVIERPASVVKELVENAIDAHSQSITVEVNGSGIDLIRVVDNGIGMGIADCEIAILRHATSKISKTSDLFAIGTLGFRGEALPSIASVSKTSISTRTASSDHGWMISLEAGKVINKEPKGMPGGTIITVKDLFYNTPARKKFLKTAATEQRHILEVVSRYAMAYPSIRFQLKANERNLIDLPQASSEKDRILALLGKSFQNKIQPFSSVRPGLKIHGFLASPEMSRPSRAGIYTFVNKRSVRDATLSASVVEGFRGMLMTKRFPVAILFMEIDPLDVDVNVHPTKAEVKFTNPSAVFGIIVNTIKKHLHKEILSEIDIPAKKMSYEVREYKTPGYAIKPDAFKPGAPLRQDTLLQLTPGFYTGKAPIGTLHSTYILLEDDQSLFILDQHAAHERINFEKLKRLYDSEKSQSQLLMNPIIIELSRSEYLAYEEIEEHINKTGIEVSPFGEREIAVRSVPAILQHTDIKMVILDLIHAVVQGLFKKSVHADDILASIACHKSVRSGKNLSIREIEGLLKDLDRLGSPGTCPHGRPIYKKIGLDEIERWIGRRP